MRGEVFQKRYCRLAISLLLSLAMILTTFGVGNLAADAASKPAFQKSKLNLTAGKSAELKVKKMPKGAKVVSTKWKVQKTSVLKLTLSGSKAKKKKAVSAKVTGLKAGKSAVYCTVTYQVKKGKKWQRKKSKVQAMVTVAEKTKVTPVPSGTKTPGTDGTDKPTATGNPGGVTTGKPTATGNPGGVTTAPGNTEEPGEATPTPEVTEKPGDATTAPIVTPEPTPTPTVAPEYDFSKTALEFSKEMKIGWNLGNTLDATMGKGEFVAGNAGLASETAWGCPKATEKLIKAVKEAGFNTVRIPVTWTNHTDLNNNYQIDETWMNRVEEVVKWCTDNGLHVIINAHHDGADNPEGMSSWLAPNTSNASAMKERYQRVWEQIAARFKYYSNLVLFSSMNEFHHGYDAPPASYYTLQNELHQIFVDTVRKSGGYNASRYLILPGYNTNIDQTIAGLKLPTDSCKDHLMVEVHYYDPYTFAADGNETSQWGSDFGGATSADSWGQEKYLIEQLKKMKTAFIDKGVGVVIGEFGAPAKDAANEKYRTYFLQYVVKYSAEYGLVPIFWDNGANFRLFDRNTGAVVSPDIVNGMMAALTPGYEIPLPR